MDFSAVDQLLDKAIEDGIPGCECIVQLDGKTVYSASKGVGSNQKPFEGHLYYLYSLSKLMTCTAAFQLMEKGKICLDDPVSKYLPEYEKLNVMDGEGVRPAKTVLTIRHLMSMQGGFDYGVYTEEINEFINENGGISTVQAARFYAKKPLMFDPGTGYAYSVCHDILAAIIEIASGIEFGEYCRRFIMEPCGMTHTRYATWEYSPENFADEYEGTSEGYKKIDRSNWFLLKGDFKSGGAGVVSNKEDYILLISALACDGVAPNGTRILEKQSIELMREPQDHGEIHDEFIKAVGLYGYGYGLGVRRMLYPRLAGSTGTTDEFGWNGAAGSYVVADPSCRLAIYYGQFILGCGYAYETIHPNLRNLVYNAIK